MAEALPFGRSIDLSSDNIPEHYCDPCYELKDKIKPIAGHCIDCGENLCIECFNNHLGPKPSRNHKLVDKSAKPLTQPKRHAKSLNTGEKCSVHGETIQSFCTSHSELCCKVCLTINHKTCDLEEISKKARHIQNSQELQILNKKLKKIQKGFEDNLRKTGHHEMTIQKNFTNAINEMKKLRDKIDNLLNETEKLAEEVKEEDFRKIETVSSTCNIVIEQINNIASNLDRINKNKDNKGVFISMKRAESQLQSLQDNLVTLDNDNTVREYNFEPDEKLHAIMRDLKVLGHLNYTGYSKTQHAIYGSEALPNNQMFVTDHDNNKISRQKQALSEELVKSRNDIERLQTHLNRVSKENENLTQDKGELIVQVTATERENRQQAELVAALRMDKEGLEGNLYEAQTQASQLEVRKQQLEVENQDLLVRKENLQGEITRLVGEKDGDLEKYDHSREELQKRLAQLERDMQMALTQEKQAHEEDVDRMSREKNRQRCELENERESILHKHAMEKEDMTQGYNRMHEDLEEQLSTLQRDRDNSLLMAENDRQQMETEKAAVYGEKQALEQERSGIREELVRVEQEKMDLDTEKAGLIQTLELSEMKRQQLEDEIMCLKIERADVTEQLNAVEREKMRSEEIASKTVMERTSLDRSLMKMDEDNTDLAMKVQNLQATLADAEQQHAQRLIDLTPRHRAETEMKTERLRQAQMQTEKLLEALERSHRQKTKGMEETGATHKDQLSVEMRKEIQRRTCAGEEISDSRTPTRRRSPLRTPPTRLGAQSPFRRNTSPLTSQRYQRKK